LNRLLTLGCFESTKLMSASGCGALHGVNIRKQLAKWLIKPYGMAS
jgi:hypothetical protein